MADGTDVSGQAVNWITGNANVLANLANNLGAVQKLITGFAFIMGMAFAFKALQTLKMYGESRSQMSSSSNFKEPLIYFIVAAVFLFVPSALNTFLTTTFGSSNILQYAPINSSNSTLNSLFGPDSTVGGPLTMIIQTIGLIAFIRGWILIARSAGSGQQPGGMGKGLMHIFGGILALNIVQTINIINNSLYGG